MRAAIVGACSCSAISAAASSVSLIASSAEDSLFAFKLVNAYFLRSSSPKVMSSLRLSKFPELYPEIFFALAPRLRSRISDAAVPTITIQTKLFEQVHHAACALFLGLLCCRSPVDLFLAQGAQIRREAFGEDIGQNSW